MNNTKKMAAAIAMLGCAACANVLAQDHFYEAPPYGSYDPSWYIAPSLNATHPDEQFGSDHHGEGLGLRFGKAISPHWDIQFGPSYSRQRLTGIKYEQTMAGFDGLLMLSRDRFRPFLLVGGGLERDKVDRFGFHGNENSRFLNAGVGFQYSFNNRWGMQADVRRARTYVRGDDFNFDRANTNILTIGLTYAFNQRARPIATPPTPAPVAVAPPAPEVIIAPPPAPVPTPPPPPPRFERYTLSSTELFDFDSAVLRMPQPKLDETADLMSRNAQIANITVTGYTDRLGSNQYNMRLSQRRADSVKNYLISKGISASRLTAIGRGESNPVVTCTNKNRAALIACLEPNRRVEVQEIVVERRVQ